MTKKPQPTPEDVAAAVLRLYRARVARKETRAALRAYREKHGSCDGVNHETGPCYYHYPAIRDWCDICRFSQPLWELRRKAYIEATTALVSLLHLGKALSAQTPEEEEE